MGEKYILNDLKSIHYAKRVTPKVFSIIRLHSALDNDINNLLMQIQKKKKKKKKKKKAVL